MGAGHRLRTPIRFTRPLVCGLLVAATGLSAGSQEAASAPPQQSTDSVTQVAAKLPVDQLDALVAPVALYPDSLLAQVLAASTYPLELVQLQQWIKKNPNLKDKELADAVGKESWDPSIQSLAGLPEVVNRLADDIQWTTDLGNAFLAQQSDVMDAVQRMRKKAQDKGALKSDDHQKVETKVVESKTVVVIEQANPQVVYVPSYNPTVVYGPPVYAYPPIYYPPPGYYAAGMFMTFSVGVAMGAMWSGGWCCGASWGASNVQINNYNNFNRNTNVNRNTERNRTGGRDGRDGGRGGDRGGGRSSNFQHNPQHRGGAPYGDRATADRFGGTARGDAGANRQGGAQQLGTGQRGTGNRSAPTTATSARSASTAGTGARSSAGAGSAGSIGSGARGGGTGGTSGGFGGSGGGSSSAFGGGSRGYNGASTRAASQRGASSFSGRGGGGGGGRARGGGGRGRR